MLTGLDLEELKLKTIPRQEPEVVIRIGGELSPAMSLVDAKKQPFSDKATQETTFEIEGEMIIILTTILGGNPQDKSDLELSRKLITLGMHSASLSGLSKGLDTPILTTLQSDLLSAPQNGHFTTTVCIKRTVGKSLQIDYVHAQEDQQVGKGTSNLIIDKYPLDTTEGISGNAPAKINLPPKQERITAPPFFITQTQTDTYAEITGDQSPAHTEAGYLAQSRFEIPETIAHGTLVGSACLMRLSEALRENGYEGGLVALLLKFRNPVITEKTEITAFLDKEPQTLENGNLKFSLTVVDQEQNPLICGWIEIQTLINND